MPDTPEGSGPSAITVGYVNVYVTDFDAGVDFLGSKLGLTELMREDDFGYASFDAGPIQVGLAKVDPDDPIQAAMAGTMTGIGFIVDDLDAVFTDLSAQGVEFAQTPQKMPWGGYLALVRDTDGNVFYLDQANVMGH